MDTAVLVFQGDRPAKNTVVASVLVFALAAGTIVIAAFLLIAVFRDMSSVRTKRRLRELEPAVAKELPKALTVRRNKTKSTLPGISTRPTILRALNVRRNVSSNYKPASADLTSTRSAPPKNLNARWSHTSYTSSWYPEGGEPSEARVTRWTTSYESISTYGGREDSFTTSGNRSDAGVIVDSTLMATRDDKEAPHKISSHRTSDNKEPRSVRTVNQNPANFPSPVRTEAHSRRVRVPKATSTAPPLVLFQSTPEAKLGSFPSSSSSDSKDVVVTHRHKRHMHGQHPVSISTGTEQTHKIHVVTAVPDKILSASQHTTSERFTRMPVNTSVEAITRHRTSRAAATGVISSSTEASKPHRITEAATPASLSSRTHLIHVGSIPGTSSDSTPMDSANDARSRRAISSVTNIDHEGENADNTNYKSSIEAAKDASSKNDTHPSHVGSVPQEKTNLKETTLRHHLHSMEEAYASADGARGSTERKSLDSEEPFTEEDGADVSRTTKQNHEAFRLDISHTPSSTRERADLSTHSIHVRRIRTSTSPTTGSVEETQNGSQSGNNADTEASSTFRQTVLSTLGTKFPSEPRTLRGDSEGSTEQSSHVFVGPGNWNDLAKDDEDAHTHGHVPIPDHDGRKSATVGFPLNVFNGLF
ncbi:hypothetical protein HPB51_016364 [Rhipicephalus microplus]|uniref:Uncharacterized protein n=1 Tax=Rhipicephalus microplus TaxID=6941 RepID=A0A9J6DHK5_RHIMP|nr:hypothetical protein HPB51_016364 [Rhipicephalus microplus]